MIMMQVMIKNIRNIRPNIALSQISSRVSLVTLNRPPPRATHITTPRCSSHAIAYAIPFPSFPIDLPDHVCRHRLTIVQLRARYGSHGVTLATQSAITRSPRVSSLSSRLADDSEAETGEPTCCSTWSGLAMTCH